MNTRRCRFSVRLLALLTLLASAGLAPAVPQQIDYQGKLTDSAGTPFDGATSMVFRIWNHVSAGSVVWAETQATVNVESGLFHVNLGERNPIEVPGHYEGAISGNFMQGTMVNLGGDNIGIAQAWTANKI